MSQLEESDDTCAVLKFGGTSMGTAAAMRRAAAIVRARRGKTVVVVSATSKTTDALIALGKAALAGGDWNTGLDAIMLRHVGIVSELGMSTGLSSFWTEIRNVCEGIATFGELSPAMLDRLQGFGERMSATVFASHLNAEGVRAEMVDAFHLVATDDEFGCANVNFPTTNARTADVLSPVLVAGVIPVVTGFIGRSASGKYATLGRGGSDYSGAIMAAAMRADELQIWTDVAGMFAADPRIVPAARPIDQLSYAEAGELAYFGARVLHPLTIKPAIEAGIPVRILDTFHADAPGTLITREERPSIKSVTRKKGITVMNISSLGMLGAYGFLAKVFDAFGRHHVVVDVLASSEVSISVTVDREVPHALLDELGAFATVEPPESGKAIVCLVGEGIRTRTDVLRRLFAAVGDVHVRMASQGASARNITFVVAESEADVTVANVFREFFNS